MIILWARAVHPASTVGSILKAIGSRGTIGPFERRRLLAQRGQLAAQFIEQRELAPTQLPARPTVGQHRSSAPPLRYAPWGLIALSVLACGLAIMTGGHRIARHFEDDGGMDWLNSAQLVAAGAFALAVYFVMLGRRAGPDRRPRLWLFVSLVSFTLASDEALELHSQLGRRLEALAPGPYPKWGAETLLVAACLLAAALVWRYWAELTHSRSALILFALGALLLGFSVTVDALTAGPLRTLWAAFSAPRGWLTLADEVPEFLGCTMLLAGVLRRLSESIVEPL